MNIGGKIRRLRKRRGLTLEELADQSDLTKGFISQLERDMTDPSFSNLKRVIEALGLELTSFFGDLEEAEKNLFQKNDRTEIGQGEGHTFFSLTPKLRYLEMVPNLLVISPQMLYETQYAEDEGFGFVHRGKVQVEVEGEKKTLYRGDCFYLFFDNKLVVRNMNDRPAEILMVNY
ncbi:MAG: helix-turn-helix domain-containing protein [Calditrichia bacterium]